MDLGTYRSKGVWEVSVCPNSEKIPEFSVPKLEYLEILSDDSAEISCEALRVGHWPGSYGMWILLPGF